MPTVLTVLKQHGGEAYIDRSGRRYTEIYQVTFDAAATPYEARTASGLPTYGSTYAEDTTAKFLNKSVDKTASRKVWMVSVSYVTPSVDTPEQSPLNDPVQISIEPRERTVVCDKDKDGRAILNSAKDKFDPPKEEDDYDSTLTIARNEATANFGTIEEYQGSTNASSLTIAGKSVAARTGKLIWSASKQERNGYAYYSHTYRIDLKADLWDLSLLDHGLYYLDANGIKRRILEDGKPVDEPQLLNGSGGMLIPQPPIPTATGASYTFVAVGYGTHAHISALAFGNVTIGRASEASLKIVNKTSVAITVSTISGLGDPFKSEPSGTVAWSIPAGGFRTIGVTYTPLAAGAHNDTLTIVTVGAGTINITITGTGVAVPVESYVTYRRRKEKNWSTLGLPTTA